VVYSTSDWLERHVFSARNSRGQQRRKSHDCLGIGPEPITGRLLQIVLITLLIQDRGMVSCGCRCLLIIYCGTSVFLCGISLISVVDPSVLYMYVM
jgi:hypothetical protein